MQGECHCGAAGGAGGVMICGDCLETMRDMEPNSVDAIVRTRRTSSALWASRGITQALRSTRHMGGMLRVFKPGGYLLVFGGTRTYHRIGRD